MYRMITNLSKVFLTLAFAVALSGSAWAIPVLDFGIVAPTTGTITYAGGVAPMIGTDISVDNVVGINTPLNSGGTPLTCVACVLNFTTGNLTGTDAGHWFFDGGGSITIVGGVPGAGVAGGTTLLSGTLSPVSTVSNGLVTEVIAAGFIDIKDETLAAYFGLGGFPGWFGDLNLSFTSNSAPPASFSSSDVLSGDVVNTPVPEPGSLFLLGSGLVGIASFARRKLRKS